MSRLRRFDWLLEIDSEVGSPRYNGGARTALGCQTIFVLLVQSKEGYGGASSDLQHPANLLDQVLILQRPLM